MNVVQESNQISICISIYLSIYISVYLSVYDLSNKMTVFLK